MASKFGKAVLFAAALSWTCALLPLPSTTLVAQAPAASRILGTVTSIQGNTVSVKSDAGTISTFTVASGARMLRTEPGQKTLAGAQPISVSDLSIGDRVLVVLAPAADGAAPSATTVIAMKQADIAQKQQADEADWQKRGAAGVVKTLDVAQGVVTISTGTRLLQVHISPATVIRRYSLDSVKFSDATKSSADAIHPGDQLRARGDRSQDRTEMTAEEIVFGTFRNIAGTVISTNPAAGTLNVVDLATKKPVTIHINTDTQMHQLPPMMAQIIAARFKAAGGNHVGGPAQNAAPPAARTDQQGARPAMGAGEPPRDLSQVLQRAPSVQLSDLHKGGAVMIVATQGTPDATTAITVLSGVEPLLQASPGASQSVFSASWTIGGGGEGEAGGEQP